MRKNILTEFQRISDIIRGGNHRSKRDMVQTISLQVHLAHDDEADVWYVASSDIPGLVLESDTVEQLIARIKEAAPQMIELNCDEILAREAPTLFAKDTVPAARPSLSWKPVFDSGFALA